MNERGVSLIELITVTLIIGILANIAYPSMQGMRTRAVAASVAGDINAIRVAVLSYYADNDAFPPSDPWASVPPELVSHLPQGFSFTSSNESRVTYRWQSVGSLDFISVQDNTPDRKIVDALRSRYPPGEIGGSGSIMQLYIY